MNASPRDGFIVTQDRFSLKRLRGRNLQCTLIRARGSVRRASGLVQIAISLNVPLHCLPVSKAVRTCEEMGGNFRGCWCSMDDPCAVAWVVTSRKTQQLSGYVRGAVGS